MEAAPTFRLIVGLGNPGSEYEKTRHNIGFMIADRLAQRAGIAFRVEKKWRAETASRDGVHLCKPMSFMNNSGEPVGAMSRFYQIAPAEILVVLDDAALDLGKLRLRPGGSSGGHNGLQSIRQHVGDVPRLRIGIGSASGPEMTNHVLGRFGIEELAILEQTLTRALEAIDVAQTRGLEVAMNQFN